MAGKAVPVGERAQQRLLVNICPAHLAQHQGQQHLVASGVQHATPSLVARTDAGAPMGPANVIDLSALGIIAVVLQDRQHGAVSRPQIILCAGDAVVAVVPSHVCNSRDAPIRIQKLGEVFLDARDILVIAGRKQEQAGEPVQKTVLLHSVLAGVKLGRPPDDDLRFRAVQREGWTVGPQHRHLDGHLLGLAGRCGLDIEREGSVLRLGLRQRVAKQHQRVPAHETLPIDTKDDIPFAELAECRGVRMDFLHGDPDALVDSRLNSGRPDRPHFGLVVGIRAHAVNLRLVVDLRRALEGPRNDRDKAP